MSHKPTQTRAPRFKIMPSSGLNRSSHHGRSDVPTRQLIRDIEQGYTFFKTNPKRAGAQNDFYSR